MLNRVILIGRLVADPELRYTNSGIAVCSFRLAVDRSFKNQQGEREADFINCKAWRQPAELISKYMTKGRLLAVEGRLEVRTYEDKEGQKRTAYDVVIENFQFVDSGKGGGTGGGPGGSPQSDRQNAPSGDEGQVPPDRHGGDYNPATDVGDDDLPF